tara:strand:- start:5858 stop:6346 length:489 start_codon:yes stop_codon:yes gene_type:complete
MKRIVLKIALSLSVIFFFSCEKKLTVKEQINPNGSKVSFVMGEKYLTSHWDLFIYANKEKPSSWEEFTITPVEEGKYSIQAHTGKFLSADLGSNQELESNRDRASLWEKFEIVEVNDSLIALKAANKKFVSLNEKDLRLYAVSDTITPQTFITIKFLEKEVR